MEAKWSLGIQNPFTEAIIGILELSTLGHNYENYFIKEDGEAYWHVLDSDTEKPAKSRLGSVSIMAKDNILSTALFVMGLDEAKNY